MHTPSQTFMAVRFDTTGKVDRNPLDVVKKFNIVVTPVHTEIHVRLTKLKYILKLLHVTYVIIITLSNCEIELCL